MKSRIVLLILALLPGFGLLSDLGAETPPTFSKEDMAFYQKEVLPLLKESCYKCHGDGKAKGGFNLTSRKTIIEGGETGPGINKLKPEDGVLLKAVHYRDGLEMPPTGKLPAEKLAIITRWVKAGLPMPEGEAAPVEKGHPKAGVVTPESKNYWAYRPLKKPEVPGVKNTAWVRSPIDAFVLAKLEEKGLKPAPEADRMTLIRRLYYDLIGLPPTPEEIDAFVNDPAADAWEKLIDKLLAMPQYGERWGRHWLDLVRYAETNGYERDGPKPYAWRYRDYVIRSFNDDKPYSRFVLEQLAGDELPDKSADSIIATGYYRLGLWDDEPADPKQARFDELDDYVATTGQVFLGMTMNCARCHDHKIDPIPQADYYRMLAFFADIRHFSESRDPRSMASLTDISPPEIRATYEAEFKKREIRKADLQKQLTELENTAIKKMPAEDQRASEGPDRPLVLRKVRDYMTPEQKRSFAIIKAEIDLQNKLPPSKQELALSVNNCMVKPPQATIMIRGNPHSPGAKVEPGFPKVLTDSEVKLPELPKDAKTAGRRSILANWIVSPENQIAPRVMVNRIWQQHFGRGIVSSTNDFGKFGTNPTHPELLDWLAVEFRESGWKFKAMHKQILTSSTWKMSSKFSAEGRQSDPSNNLLWRFNMRRLSAEEVRDSILSASGNLNPKMGGPSIYPPIPKEVLAGQSVPGQGWHTSPPEEANRRSVYVFIKRSLQLPILAQYDQADTDSSCPVRYTTTVPTQALGMINGQFMNDQAATLLKRIQKAGDREAQIRQAIRLTAGRPATDAEVKKDLSFVAGLMEKSKLDETAAMRQFCLMILNTNEFVYLD